MPAESPGRPTGDPVGFEAVVGDVVRDLVAVSPQRLDDYRHNRPGAFGFFAGRAVGGVRRALGRDLDERERRLVWQRIWERLEAFRASAPPEPDERHCGR